MYLLNDQTHTKVPLDLTGTLTKGEILVLK